MKIALYKTLKNNNISVRQFAAHTFCDNRAISVGRSKLGAIINGEKPTTPQKKNIENALQKCGIPVNGVWKHLSDAQLVHIQNNNKKTQEVFKMAGQRLWPETIERFKITEHGKKAFMPRLDTENVYRHPEYSRLEKTLIEAIIEQDTFCLIGPRGCGKSTLLNATIKKQFPPKNSKYAVKIIRQHNKDIAKTTVHNLLVSLCRGANTKLKGGNREDQSWFTIKALNELRKGTDSLRPVLVIEDAHLLHTNVLVALKQFMEMETETGERALGIIMLAQEPMNLKMGPGTEQLWERCYTIDFPPLVPAKHVDKLTARHLAPLKGYIEFRLQLAGLDPAKVFEGNNIVKACKFIVQNSADYPLMINNYLIERLNNAASTQDINPKITAEHIGNISRAA